jgi:hypothetical protein
MGIIHPSTHPVEVIGITDSENARTTFDVQLEEGFANYALKGHVTGSQSLARYFLSRERPTEGPSLVMYCR